MVVRVRPCGFRMKMRVDGYLPGEDEVSDCSTIGMKVVLVALDSSWMILGIALSLEILFP